MPSLTEAYTTDRVGPSLGQLLVGLILFLLGALLIISGIIVATTEVIYGTDIAALTAKRQFGGVLAGSGIPAVLLGVFTVLPSARMTKIAAVVGAVIAMVGVGLFRYAYPCRWSGSTCGAGLADLTLLTVGIYFLGALTAFWALFAGIANVKLRNNPGGTATINVQTKGETKYIERESTSGLSGIGLFGKPSSADPLETASSDGGEHTEVLHTPSEGSRQGQTHPQTKSPDKVETRPTRGETSQMTGENPEWNSTRINPSMGDEYCGTCDRFEYRQTETGIQPYCAAHDEYMDDMDPCEQWEPRQGSGPSFR
jgi:hypothetical protein